MQHADPKPIMIAGAMMLAMMTTTVASGVYWVVGNLVTNSCDIVSRSPVVSPGGPIWFGNGPYKSYDDARQASRAISACPASGETAGR